MMKRSLDIFFSSIGLFILMPLFVIMAIIIKLDSSGPVFFRQKRIGRNFCPFFIYKFRTMTSYQTENGPEITVGGDSRITKVGRILRKIKIDELPQLINVLKGEMSLVGPRPEVQKYVELYRKDYEEILKVRPGITDIASIVFRDEEGFLKDKEDPVTFYSTTILPKKIMFAKEYIRQRSLGLDIKLVLKTFLRIFNSNSHYPIV